MSKKKLLARGVIFAYGAIGSQILYSFASIPLALTHLSKAEFGMWGLITTIVGYLQLAELGMTNAATRHLMECKEGRDPLKFGRLFAGSAMALCAVALVIAFFGFMASQFAGHIFSIPADLSVRFANLMIGQSILLSITMAAQMLGAPLYVHHRQDLSQLSQIGLFIIYYVTLRLAFGAGWGIYAMLASQAAGLAWGVSFNVIACLVHGFYPTKKTLGIPTKEEWSSVWRYSRDVFAIQIGSLLLASIPQVTLARLLGLEAVATWAVCTRPFAILRQMVGRPFDVTLPVIYDDYIAGNMTQVTRRWTDVTQLVLAVAAVVFAVAAANNSTFIDLWTKGRIHWAASNHWLLALYFLTVTAAGLAAGGLGISKTIGNSRFIGMLQVPVTIALAIPLAKWYGTPGLIVALALPYVPGTILFGVRYLASITGSFAMPLFLEAILRPALTAPLAALGAWICSMMTNWIPGYPGLILSASSGSLIAMIAMLMIGVSPRVRTQILSFGRKLIARFLPWRPVGA